MYTAYSDVDGQSAFQLRQDDLLLSEKEEQVQQ